MDDRLERFRQELARLTALNGVSGHEQEIVAHLREAVAPLSDRVEVDPIGNLYARRDGGNGPHLLVAAHSDEIGALVAGIEPDGFLRLERVGGIPEAMMIGRKVRVRGLLGVIGVRPGHLQSPQEARTAPEVAELYVDLGAATAGEVAGLGFGVGDQVTWQSELEPLANPNRVAGKAIDNRFGCLIVLELLRSLRGVELPGPLTVAIAVQEEVGLKGARVVAERIRPSAAVVVDTTPCPDTPDSRRPHTFPVRLGHGPVLQVSSGARAGGFILPETVRDYLVSVAEGAGIPYQLAAFAYGNTDAAAIYSAAGGIPTAPITVPRRYSHSPVEVLDLDDALNTLRLVEQVVQHSDEFPHQSILAGFPRRLGL
jgi:endoglucanase